MLFEINMQKILLKICLQLMKFVLTQSNFLTTKKCDRSERTAFYWAFCL